MLRIHFTRDDIAKTTMAAEPDPLWEVLLSLHMLQDDSAGLVWGGWRRALGGLRRRPDLRLLLELAPPSGYSPDFLTPPGVAAGLETSIELLMSTPRTGIRSQLEYLVTRRGTSPLLRCLAMAESSTMQRLGDAIRTYHGSALAPYWDAIRQHVVNDRASRAQQFLDHGIDHVLTHLHPRVRWRSPVLEIMDFVDTDLFLEGRGLRLQPSFFCWGAPTKLRDSGMAPVLVYPTHPAPGVLRRTTNQMEGPTRTSLAALVGPARALVLEAAVGGRNTTSLGLACRISPATASQHASVLREAGLLTTRRMGRSVLHEVTPLGLALLNGRSQ